MTLVVLETGACSDVGQIRQSNEDALLLDDPVFAVADGMGGARAGEVASAMAVAALHGLSESSQSLAEAIEGANRRIFEASHEDPSLLGMGTTVTAVLVEGSTLVIAHVGDSRAYLYRAGELRQVTDDHSLVGELVRLGEITPAQAERHPQRSVITRALGADIGVEVDVIRVPAEPDDVLLLCSDGLSGMVPDPELARIMKSVKSLDEAARELVRAANAAGGEDNSTAVLLRIGVRGEQDGAAPVERGPVVILPATALTAGPAGDQTGPDDSTPQPAPVRRGRFVMLAVVACVIGIACAGLLAAGLHWVHFIGATPGGQLGVYQGLPLELPNGIALYRVVAISSVPIAVLSVDQRTGLLNQQLGSRARAQGAIDSLVTASPWLQQPQGSG